MASLIRRFTREHRSERRRRRAFASRAWLAQRELRRVQIGRLS